MNIRFIANVFLLASALLAAPSVSPAQPQIARSVHDWGCAGTVVVQNATNTNTGAGSRRQGVLAVCEGGVITSAKGFMIKLDSKSVIEPALTIVGRGRSEVPSVVGSNLAQIQRGQYLRRK